MWGSYASSQPRGSSLPIQSANDCGFVNLQHQCTKTLLKWLSPWYCKNYRLQLWNLENKSDYWRSTGKPNKYFRHSMHFYKRILWLDCICYRITMVCILKVLQRQQFITLTKGHRETWEKTRWFIWYVEMSKFSISITDQVYRSIPVNSKLDDKSSAYKGHSLNDVKMQPPILLLFWTDQ